MPCFFPRSSFLRPAGSPGHVAYPKLSEERAERWTVRLAQLYVLIMLDALAGFTQQSRIDF